MSLVDLIDTRVTQKVDELSEFSHLNNSIRQGIGFSIYSLERIFGNFNNTEIETGIVDSSYRQEKNDYGIDALYITANNEYIETIEQLEDYNEQSKFEIHILQFKKGSGIDDPTLLKLQDGIKKSFITNEIKESNNEYMYEYVNNLKKIKQYIYQTFPYKNISIKIYLVFSGSKSVAYKNPSVTEKILDIKNDLDSSGYRNVNFEIYGAQELIDLENGNEDISGILEYKQSFKYITAGTNEKKLNGHIAIVKGEEIAKLVEKFQNALFELNIRDFYTKNPNNEKIIETASSSEEAKFFWSFNNGLTITCKEVDDLPESKLKVSGMQIVNGCQTSNSIYKAYSNRKRYEELLKKEELTKKEEEEIDKIKNYCLDYNTSVLVKIIETQDEDLVYRITESTNSQTAISSFSIKANEDIHKNIETFMKEYNIYYERRVNYYRNQKDISTKDIIDIKKMAQVFMSMIKIHPSQAMSSPKAMFENNYKTIFPDPGVKHGIDYKLYLVPALIQQNVEQKIKYIQRRKKEKKIFNKKILSYGKFHLGCFILSSILDKDYNERSISVNFEKIKNNLENSTLFDVHFEYAVKKLKEALNDLGCDNEDAVSQYLKSKDIDTKIATMVKGKKMIRATKVKVESN